jgi:hypothetical protein
VPILTEAEFQELLASAGEGANASANPSP